MLLLNFSNFMLPLRGAQALTSVIVLGVTSYVASWWNKYWRDMSPAEINFLLFNSVWTLLSLIYVVGTSLQTLRFSRFANRYALLVLDALTMIFWFAGFVALAVFLGARVCFGNVCSVAKAAIVFAAIEWLLFAATTAYTAMYALRAHRMSNAEKRPEEESTTSSSPIPPNDQPPRI